jgi:hypothetical protein
MGARVIGCDRDQVFLMPPSLRDWVPLMLYAYARGNRVFGQVKFNRQLRRFQRRGRAACRSEWRLIAATHNLLKLHGHPIAAIPA